MEIKKMYMLNRTLYIDNAPIGTARPSSNSNFLLYSLILSKETYQLVKGNLDFFVNKEDVEKALKLYESVKERTGLIEFTFPIKIDDLTYLFSYLDNNIRDISMRINRNDVQLFTRDGIIEQKYATVKLKALYPEKFFSKNIQEKFKKLRELLEVEITELSMKDKSIVDISFKSPVVFTKDKIKLLKEVKDWFSDEIKNYLENVSDQFEVLCRYYTSLFGFVSDLESLINSKNQNRLTRPVYYLILEKFNTVYVSTKIPKEEFEILKSLNLKEKYRVVLFNPETKNSRTINLEKLNYEDLRKVKI